VPTITSFGVDAIMVRFSESKGFAKLLRPGIGIFVLAGLLIASFQLGSRQEDQSDLTIRRVEASAVTDLADDRKLVGFADTVFFGEVVAKVGLVAEGALPETQYVVNVTEMVKGTPPGLPLPDLALAIPKVPSLSLRGLDPSVEVKTGGVIVVNQQGGYVAERNELVLMVNDSLLEPGGSYLFATRLNPETGWHTVMPGYGDIMVRSDQDRDALRARFTTARDRQIAFPE
jgi:hypothetical protein